MKKLWLAIGLTALFAVPAAQGALSFTVDRTGAYWQGSGGEFTINPTGGTWPAPTSGSSFKTFCVESTENINPNGAVTYYGAISTEAKLGGAGGGSPDPLSRGASFLFYQYWKGNLGGAGGINTGAEAGALQNALWALEDENGGSIDATYTALLKGMFGLTSTLTDWQMNATGAWDFGPRVLNVYTSYNINTGVLSGLAQDQLIMVPEPTTIIAGALLLLPFGASTIRFIRKNRAA